MVPLAFDGFDQEHSAAFQKFGGAGSFFSTVFPVAGWFTTKARGVTAGWVGARALAEVRLCCVS